MVGNHYARKPAHVPLALSERDTEALKQIRAEYASAGILLGEDSRNVDKARSRIIQQANPHAQRLSADVFRKVLYGISGRSGRNAGFTMPKDALERACARQSLGPDGVIPATYMALVSHIAAACHVIDDLVYPRR